MIELRWLNYHSPDGTHHKILQYRQQYDPTIRAGLPSINSGLMTGFNPTLVWSAWKDVDNTWLPSADENSHT